MALSCGEKKDEPQPDPEQNLDPATYVFSIDPVQVVVPATGGNIVVTVTCSGAYHINSMPDWIKEKDSKDKQHVFMVSPYGGEKARSGPIVFCDEIINEELGGTCIPCIVRQTGTAE